MDRLACVEVPDLLLQQALQDHPDWVGQPVAVVAEDRPLSPILQATSEARRLGVRPGMRYAAALALVPTLRGQAASDRRQDLARDRLHRVLSAFSPAVEPSRDHPGTLWADVRGMQRLFPSANAWGHAVRETLAREGYRASVVVGFSRFATWALARMDAGVLAFRSRDREREALTRVPLARVPWLPPDRREALEVLGIATLGDLLRVPREGLSARFGAEVEALRRAASGEGEDPLRPVPVPDPLREAEDLEEREEDPDRLLFWVKRLLDRILGRLAMQGMALGSLQIRWTLDDLLLPSGVGQASCLWTVRPADPATRSLPLLTLLRLRLASDPLPAPVVGLALQAEAVPLPVGQLRLFRETRRDPVAAREVLARLRARFGEEAVVGPRLGDAWLPEEAGRWVPLEELAPPRPRAPGPGPRVRRVLPAPVELSIPGDRLPFPGLPVRGLGTVRAWKGPFWVSGRWWDDREVRREYGYLETRDGQVIWVFREGGRWWVQGRVE
ncbi:MAG TPA: DNA polymerase Y family protein [Myxococcota bacterium]|nr:DNA polymerase Y family protein [Myxococcota bacterium]HQK52536.1 DNA polymerase Y family protein [Myxococcota bacterium]